MSSLIGRTLSHYQVLEEIGRGAMGVVYRARDIHLNRDVALKVLPPELVADPERRQRFVLEARAASALEHPHIAVIHEIGEADGISFIAMEHVRGEKLSDVLARGPLLPSRALDLAAEIAEGLARAHEKGILHRDLKPANVMLTEEGHAKIIDFGLAKLVEPDTNIAAGETMRAETDAGVTLGTMAYMSPEQARAGKVDHRSDIFSFGLVLYEMLTGQRAYSSQSGLDTLHAILHDPAPRLPPLGSVGGDAVRDVQRIIDKCLAKDPGSRFQGMRDLVVDLRAARFQLETSGASPIAVPASVVASTPVTAARGRAWIYAAAAVLVLGAGLGGVALWRSGQTATPVAGSSGKPSVAVLYFENNTGNAQLDWMRTGLTDMLVTDLSQSPDVEVLGSDRLVQILGDMKHLDDRQISFETVQELARRAGVKSVILGSYVKAGETIRINVKLQEAGTGRIVSSERVEAANESNLFTTVDDLTRRIKNRFLPGNADPTKPLLSARISTETTTPLSMDRDLKDVSTSSIEAYRYYVEGIDLHNRARELEAVPLLEKAIKTDPMFAMALTKLAVVESNLSHPLKREEYSKRALEHLDRLTARERYYIEGYYYSNKGDQLGRAIDAYKKAIDLYPDHAAARHNLALLYANLGRETEAIPLYEELRRRGMAFPITYTNLASLYRGKGEFEKALSVLQEYGRANPDVQRGHFGLGELFSAWGRWDEALAEYDKATALEPANPQPMANKRPIYIATERWPDLEAVNAKLLQLADSRWKYAALMSQGTEQLYKGRRTHALRLYEAAIAAVGPRGSTQSAGTRLDIAGLLMDSGQPAAALVSAQRAFDDAGGVGQVTFAALSLVVQLHARLGHKSEAARLDEDLTRRRNLIPSDLVKQISQHRQAAALALDRHETAVAIQELKQVEATVLAGQPTALPSFELASAYLDSGNDAEAAARFERIVNGGTQRANSPIDFVRSLYFLGQISERKGDGARARDYYARFVKYWGEGEMDREKVAEAKKRLSR